MTDALRVLPPIVILGSLWGVTPVFVKHLGALGWPPLMIAVFGAMGRSAILLTLCRLRGIRIPTDARHLRYYAVSGLFGMALANLVGFTSLQHIPAGFFLVGVVSAPYPLHLQIQEEALHRRVVPAVSFPAHAAHHLVLLQQRMVFLTGVLAASV